MYVFSLLSLSLILHLAALSNSKLGFLGQHTTQNTDTLIHSGSVIMKGLLRCTYRAYDAVDEITAAFSVAFIPAGTKIFAGYNKSIRNLVEPQTVVDNLLQPTLPRIFVPLRRCLYDSDDEVCDRATLYLNTIGGYGEVVETDKDVKDFLFGSLDIPLANVETSLKNYIVNLDGETNLKIRKELERTWDYLTPEKASEFEGPYMVKYLD